MEDLPELKACPGADQTVPASSRESRPFFQLGVYRFKRADRPEEFDEIQRLLYRAFVLEVGQYPDSGTGRHVDKFHHKNTYLVAVRADQLTGMLAVHDQPPFSVADAIPSKEALERLCPQLLEVRLLTVDKAERGRAVFGGLLLAAHRYAVAKGYRYLAISGLLQRQRMYERMGFCPLAAPVQRGEAHFVPMLSDLSNLPQRVRRDLKVLERRITGDGSTGPGDQRLIAGRSSR